MVAYVSTRRHCDAVRVRLRVEAGYVHRPGGVLNCGLRRCGVFAGGSGLGS